MGINRKTVTVGMATVALVGLTGGGVAWATTGSAAPTTERSDTFHCAGGYGMAYGKYAPMNAVADYLGLTRAELVKRLGTGISLADITRAQGKSVTDLKTVMLSAMKRALAADGDLTTAQRTAMLSMMKSHLDAMVEGTGMGATDADDMGSMMGGDGMMGGSGMMRGPGSRTMMNGSNEGPAGSWNGMMGD